MRMCMSKRPTSLLQPCGRKARKPTLEAEQRQGRALLWDRRIDREAQAEYGDANVPQQPYVYQTK